VSQSRFILRVAIRKVYIYVCDGGCRYLKCDLETFDLRDLESKFDVILIEPPLEEYQRTLGVTYDKYWSWDMVSGTTYTIIVICK